MNSPTDQELLRAYIGRRSEAAFAELVRRHIDLVYSAALRMVRDTHQAEDISQSVFVALARNARPLADRPALSGWLHRTAQNLAANAVRSAVRRRAREQEAASMNEGPSEPETDWERIAPHLDAALGELSEAERDAVLLRYFEGKSAREIAQMLGTSEDAAQKRVTRAVEGLRQFFTKHGVTEGAGIVALISANAVQAAPIGLAGTISAQAPIAVAATQVIAMTTIQKSLVAATLAVAVGIGIYEAYEVSRLRGESRALRLQQTALAEQVAQLKAENQSLSHRAVTNGERLRELLRLRGDTALLRREKRELEAALAAVLSKASSAAGTAVAAPGPPQAKSAPFQVQLVLDEPGEDTEAITNHGGTSREILHVQKTPVLDYNAIRSVAVTRDLISGAPQILIEFSAEGRDLFAEITRANVNKRLAMVLNGQLYSAPVIRSEIPGGTARISGSFSEEEAQELAAKINDAIPSP